MDSSHSTPKFQSQPTFALSLRTGWTAVPEGGCLQMSGLARRVVWLFVLLPGVWGCTPMHNLQFPWTGQKQIPQESPKNPVVKTVAIWQPAEGIGLDQMSTRGFAGQILFFTSEKQAASIVDGSMKIYVFDDQGTSSEEQGRPIHIFNFEPEVWKSHLRETQLGPAYHVFIPYTRKGMHEAHCSLKIKYHPRKGGSVTSDLVAVTLPGSKKARDDDSQEPGPTVAKKSRKSGTSSKKARKVVEDEDRDDAADEEQDEESPRLSQKQRSTERRKTVPLSDAERERILREATARGDGAGESGDEHAAVERVSHRETATRTGKNDDPEMRDTSSEESDEGRSLKPIHKTHALDDSPEQVGAERTKQRQVPELNRVRRGGWDKNQSQRRQARDQSSDNAHEEEADDEADEPVREVRQASKSGGNSPAIRKNLKVHRIALSAD